MDRGIGRVQCDEDRWLVADGGDKRHVEAVFLPWHRQWTHSLVVGALVGVAAGLAWGTTAGIVAALAWAGHVLADQLEYMGSALWFPFGTRRTRGLGLMHAGEPLPNLTVVWAACVLMFWNLWRYGAGAGSAPGLIPWLLVAGMPIVAAVPWRKFRTRISNAVSDEWGRRCRELCLLSDLLDEGLGADAYGLCRAGVRRFRSPVDIPSVRGLR